MLLVLILISLVQNNTWAQNHDMVDLKSYSLENPSKQYEKSNAAVFRYLGDNKDYCTGTYISKQGHVLSAAHCLESCFPKGEMVAWPGTLNKGKSMVLDVLGSKLTYPFFCQITKDGKAYDVEVLSGPKGSMFSPMPKDVFLDLKQYVYSTVEQHNEHISNWMSAFTNGWGRGGDFILFKIKEHKNKSCLKLTSRDEQNHFFYSLSYPIYIRDSKKENTSVQLSIGQITNQTYIPSGLNGSAYIDIPSSSSYLTTNIEAFRGSSGAALLGTNDNQIHGVLSITVLNNELRSQARFIGVEHIKRLAGSKINQINCD